MKLLFCYGTRPELLKIRPILNALEDTLYDVFFTGQHDQRIGIKSFYSSFPPLNVYVGNNRLSSVISTVLSNFPTFPYTIVVVQGDTASAFACALSSFNLRVPVAHVEAGLRSFDRHNPYPEEVYRRMISQLATTHFCPTTLSKSNLESEGIKGEKYVVGNTSLDNLLGIPTSQTGDVVVTLHRRENFDEANNWIHSIDCLAKSYASVGLHFTLYSHPALEELGIYKDLTYVKLSPPLPHEEFVKRLAYAPIVITDSGGIQEEAAFFGKKVVVCRQTTERPEAIETGHLRLCPHPNNLIQIFHEHLNSTDPLQSCPYGNGTSGFQIASILRKLMGSG
jgi:UDP-N-acetylglucosamine 2-epimerase (non-hydrolysing)